MLEEILKDKVKYKKFFNEEMKIKVKNLIKLKEEEIGSELLVDPNKEEDVSFEVDGEEISNNPKIEQEEPEQNGNDLLNFALRDESTEAEKAFALKNTEAGNGDASSTDESCEKLKEVAPPNNKAEQFINDNKEDFKKRYGANWERILYATAWKMFGNK